VTRLLIACGVVLAACSPLAPRPDRTRFFVLAPISPDPGTVERLRPDAVIGLGPMTFPSYLRRTALVTRVGPNRVTFSDDARWAEPVETSFQRVLALNLATLLGTDRIVGYPWVRPPAPDYAIAVDVSRFERTTDGGGELAARVTIHDRAGKVLERRDVRLVEHAPGGGEEDTVAALSTALAGLSREIAGSTQRLDGDRHAVGRRTRTSGRSAPIIRGACGPSRRCATRRTAALLPGRWASGPLFA